MEENSFVWLMKCLPKSTDLANDPTHNAGFEKAASVGAVEW